MRRLLALALAVVTASLVTACASSTTPGWTYAPPTPTPSQAAPTGSAAPASEQPSGGGGIGSLGVVAVNVQFDPRELTAPADTGFVIHFDNQDAGQPHNVEIKDAGGASLFKGDLITGPAVTDYQVAALAAGTYSYVCTVHANMTGVLAVN